MIIQGMEGPGDSVSATYNTYCYDYTGDGGTMQGTLCLPHIIHTAMITQGMVEPGDSVSATLKKEFGEEAMNSLEATNEEKKAIETSINTLFSGGDEVRSTTQLLDN